MNTNRFGLTPDEVEGEAKHPFEEGTVALGAVADRQLTNTKVMEWLGNPEYQKRAE